MKSRTFPVQVTVVATVLAVGFASRRPTAADPAEIASLAERFAFTPIKLPMPPEPDGGVAFGINPSAAHLKWYLLTVGASLTLGDVDGDGLSNDLCHTDVRTKALVVAPVPGTGDRYSPFEVDVDVPRGREATWPAMCRLADLNEDGRLDVLVSIMGQSPQLFLRRDDVAVPGPDAYRRVALFDREEVVYMPSINVVDIDGDGHLDLVLGGYLPDGIRVYEPTATETVELQEGFGRARNAGRNRVMLFEHATSGPEPTVRFREVDDPFPGDTEYGWTLAIGSGDIDRDGLSDLYISNDFGPDTLLLNRSTPGNVRLVELQGRRRIDRASSKVLGHDSFKGMGADLGDLNGDGLLDLYVSNIGSDFALHEGHFVWLSTGEVDDLEATGRAPYEDAAEELGVAQSAWSWDSRMDDFDNDGQLELVQATGFLKGTDDQWADIAQLGGANDNLIKFPATWPTFGPDSDIDGWDLDPFWVRTSTGRYADLAPILYPELTTNSRAIATADVDGDGDLDLAFGNNWEDSWLLRNDAPHPGRSLGLHVLLPVGEGAASHPGHPVAGEGTPAVGAWVEVAHPDGTVRVRQVDLSNGHTGARAPDLLFGLGEADPTARVRTTIRWRDRGGTLRTTTQELTPGWHTVVLGGEA